MTINTHIKDNDKSLVDEGYCSQRSQEKKKKSRLNRPNSKCSNSSSEISDKLWTNSCICDKLAYCLGSTSDYEINEDSKEIRISHKYYDQAEWVLYRINIHKPPPEFVINISDLSRKLKKEISSLKSTPTTLNEVITDAVRKILEAVNPEYYHVNGIHGKVKWRLVS